MSKVKITQEQANAIDRLREHHKNEIKRFKRSPNDFEDWLRPIINLEINEIDHAVYFGYEVEPEFKDDEWVLLTNGTITQILYVRDDATVSYPSGKKFAHSRGGDCWYDYSFIKRHSTPEEIAEEKERRTDKKLNDLLCSLSSKEKDRLYNKLVSLI